MLLHGVRSANHPPVLQGRPALGGLVRRQVPGVCPRRDNNQRAQVPAALADHFHHQEEHLPPHRVQDDVVGVLELTRVQGSAQVEHVAADVDPRVKIGHEDGPRFEDLLRLAAREADVAVEHAREPSPLASTVVDVAGPGVGEGQMPYLVADFRGEPREGREACSSAGCPPGVVRSRR